MLSITDNAEPKAIKKSIMADNTVPNDKNNAEYYG